MSWSETRGELVGNAPEIGKARTLLPLIAVSDSCALIVGEQGTGRTHLANIIHRHGPRGSRALGVLACGSYAQGSEFDELFGGDGRPGLLETCAGSTLLLAGIDEMPLAMQGRLTRYIDEAANDGVPHAPRLLASSRQELRRLVAQRRFRSDLFYRLSVVTLRLPPLRERREDIPLLANHFLQQSARQLGKRFEGIADAALEALLGYRWAGNLTELAAAIQRAAIVDPGPRLGLESLPPTVVAEQRVHATVA